MTTKANREHGPNELDTVLTLRDVRVSGCSRAGALFHESSGSLEGVPSTNSGFGLVLQGSPRPDVRMDSCVFDPNADQDALTDSELAIPNASSELPDGPGE